MRQELLWLGLLLQQPSCLVEHAVSIAAALALTITTTITFTSAAFPFATAATAATASPSRAFADFLRHLREQWHGPADEP